MNGKTLNKKAIIALSAALFSAAAGAAPTYENFYTSDKVIIETVKFNNLFGMEIAGSLVMPKDLDPAKKYSAIVIGHPFAAVRQQAATLYATKLAEEGFITLAFDQPYWGESDGYPRGSVLPDMYVETFSASVDYLSAQNFVNPEKIGALGICASGAFAVTATKIDPRIKALTTVSMYDMGEYFRTGIQGNRSLNLVKSDLAAAAEKRTETFITKEPIYGPGQNDPVFVEAKESNDFYQTARGKYILNDRRSTPASYVKFMNFYPFNDIDTISPRPILFVVGEKAPTKTYTDTAYKMAAEPKELVVVKGANRVDLYDRTDLIPFQKISSFFKSSL